MINTMIDRDISHGTCIFMINISKILQKTENTARKKNIKVL
jgi:hypothetical protein